MLGLDKKWFWDAEGWAGVAEYVRRGGRGEQPRQLVECGGVGGGGNAFRVHCGCGSAARCPAVARLIRFGCRQSFIVHRKLFINVCIALGNCI